MNKYNVKVINWDTGKDQCFIIDAYSVVEAYKIALFKATGIKQVNKTCLINCEGSYVAYASKI